VYNAGKIFPRVTMCDFTIRQMANFQDFTIECTLPINLFNEKMFIIIWFMLMLLTLWNTISLIAWIGSMFLLSRRNYVRKYLYISEKMRRSRMDMKHMRCFIDEYLRQDGVFTIRMLAKNTNDVVISEIVCKLWDHFILHHMGRREFHKNHPTDRANMDLEIETDHHKEDYVTSPTTPGNIFPA